MSTDLPSVQGKPCVDNRAFELWKLSSLFAYCLEVYRNCFRKFKELEIFNCLQINFDRFVSSLQAFAASVVGLKCVFTSTDIMLDR